MGIPHVTVPKTYVGSQTTPILGFTANAMKTTPSIPRIPLATIFYEVDLTLFVPTSITFTSGITPWHIVSNTSLPYSLTLWWGDSPLRNLFSLYVSPPQVPSEPS
jgi:hypothetical protein